MTTLRTLRILTLALATLGFAFTGTAAEHTKPDTAPAATRSKAAKIDVNTADQATLETLPGVGPQIAQEIIANRPYKSVSDLERVPGIGPAKMKDLKKLVTASKVKEPKEKPAARVREDDARAPAVTPTGRDLSDTRRPPMPMAADHRVNLNTASREELEALPEIGPVKAQAIIDARPFNSTEDVMRVKGIKQKTYDAIKDQITVR
jgi:competence protein ComEA